MQTIFVTGGAGFIGSNFVTWVLARTNVNVIIIDKLTYAGHVLNLQDVLSLPSVSFIQADIADRSRLDRLFVEHGPNAVLNFAAESHVDRSIDDPTPFIETNTVGTFVLLEAARHYWMTLPLEEKNQFRFLHVSTDEVYGTLGAGGLFSEESPYAPNSPYAASKAAADHFVRASFHTYGLPTITTNCSNNYGPYQFPEKLIPLMILNALEGKALPIYGDGQHVRDWLYVEDHCEGLWTVLCQGKPGEKYNLGGHNELSNLELVNILIDILEEFAPASHNELLKSQGMAAYNELKVFVADRPGHDRRYAIDASKVKAEFQWVPKFTLLTGLRKTVQWYLNHRNWCDTVLSNNYKRERLGLAK